MVRGISCLYSQVPPPPEIQRRKVAPPPPPAEPESATRKFQDMQQKLEDLREDRELAGKERAKSEKKSANQAENCRRARANLTALQQSSRKRIQTKDGTVRVYTPEEKAQKMAEHKEVIARDCK